MISEHVKAYPAIAEAALLGWSHKDQTREIHRRAVIRVIEHMRENLDANHILNVFAEIACCSPWHLDRIFAEQTGVTPMTYLSALRIHTAKMLLMTTKEKVINIAYDVGYNSLGSFGKRFTSMVGMSPRGLRQAADRFDPDHFRDRLKAATALRWTNGGAGATVKGHVGTADLSDPREGWCFVGLFAGRLPCGEPVRCTVCRFPGPYRLENVSSGAYSVLAAGFCDDMRGNSMLLQSGVLLANVADLEVDAGGGTYQVVFMLEDEREENPPLLLTLPLLLEARL